MDPVQSVLARASWGLAQVEQRELASERARHTQAAEEAEARRDMTAHQAHVEEVTHGYTTAELARHQQDTEAARQERILELEAELARLDPQRRANARRTQADIDAAALLHRARQAGDRPFMRREIAELERREQRRRDEIGRARLRRLEESYRPPGGPMIWR